MRFRPLFDARNASSAPLQVDTRRAAASAASVRFPVEELDDPARDERVVERKRPLDAGTHDDDVLARRARCLDHGREVQQRRDEDPLAARRCGDHSACSIGGREDQRLTERLDVLPRRVPEVEPGNANRVTLAAENALAEGVAQRSRLVHLGRTERPLVPGSERLADRRGGPDDVDDDAGRGRSGLVRSEHDVDTHAGTLTRRDRADALLPPSRPGDVRVVLRTAAADICPDCMTLRAWSASAVPITRESAERRPRRSAQHAAPRARSPATARTSPSRSSGSTWRSSCSSSRRAAS